MLVQGDMPVLTLRETMAAVWREQGALGFLRGAGLRAAWAGAGSGVYLGEFLNFALVQTQIEQSVTFRNLRDIQVMVEKRTLMASDRAKTSDVSIR